MSDEMTAATPARDSCGCPETDGKIYHQRGTCTDPVVAQLDWYATGHPTPAVTPGQAAELPLSLRAEVTQVARELRREADGIEADPYLNRFAREADAGARRTAAARIEMAVREDRARPAPTVRDGIDQALRTLRRMGDAAAPSRAARVRAALDQCARSIREAYGEDGDGGE
jgi:cation transport regulator ChaB